MKQLPELALANVLLDDVSATIDELMRADTQLNRRAFVRSLFALIEGGTFLLKQYALEINKMGITKKGVGHFSQAELALLQEEQYDLTDKGEVRTQQKFLRPTENVRFTFSALAKAQKLSHKPDVSGEGWQSFKKAINIRNRITHPRRESDLEITDGELKIIRKAFAWYVKNLRVFEK